MADTSALTQSASALLARCRSLLGGMGHRLTDVVRAREQDFLKLMRKNVLIVESVSQFVLSEHL